MRSLEVVLNRTELRPGQSDGKAISVIDVLRAGTTVAHALAADAEEIRLFNDVDDAKKAEQAFVGRSILAGERGGKRPAGYDLGNSPFEYTSRKVGGRAVFLTTTNGTAALTECAGAAFGVMSSLVNATPTADALIRRNESIVLICAGTEGRYSVEDTYCAGIMVSSILREVGPTRITLDDGARIALSFAADPTAAPYEVVSSGAHGKYLASVGFEKDLKICSELDSVDIVPVLQKEPLRLVAASGA